MENSRLKAAKLLFEIHNALKCRLKRNFVDKGITMPQGMLMGILATHGDVKITTLSEKLGLTNSTISGIVDRLEKQGMVERKRSEEDKRIVYVSLMPEYRNMHANFHKTMEEFVEKLLQKGSEEEIEKVLDGFETLKRIIGSADIANHKEE